MAGPDVTWRTSIRVSTALATCGRGRSRPICARTCAERFGPAWFESAEAGEVLQRLWRDGQRLDAEELLGELTGERLDFGVVLADLDLALA